jgi:hypothetical protein
MTKPKDKTASAEGHQMMVILLGVDEHGKPRAARFTGHGSDLLAKAAAAMKLDLVEVKTNAQQELAAKLPKGRLYSNGRGFVPYVRRDLYAKVLASCAGSPTESQLPPGDVRPLPSSWHDIAPGHVVIIQEAPMHSWWEAVVLRRVGDILSLKYRDDPDSEEYQRHVATVALMHPGQVSAKA